MPSSIVNLDIFKDLNIGFYMILGVGTRRRTQDSGQFSYFKHGQHFSSKEESNRKKLSHRYYSIAYVLMFLWSSPALTGIGFLPKFPKILDIDPTRK